MRLGVLLILAIVAVLGGVPLPTSAAERTALSTQHALDATAATTPPDVAWGAREIAIGVGGMTAVALVSWFMLLVGRRRRAGAGALTGRDAASTARDLAAERVTAVLHRRTLRRAHMRLDGDSIGVGASRDTEPTLHRTRRSARRSPPS